MVTKKDEDMDEMRTWNEMISASVVPVVIISACGLLCLAFYNRLGVVVARLRSLQRERLVEYKELFVLEEKKSSSLKIQDAQQFLHSLELQTAEVMKRAMFLRNCIFCLIGAICILILTSLLIGISVVFPAIGVIAMCFFILGLLLVFYGLIFALKEIKIALDPIKMESGFIQRLIKSELDKT